MYSQIHGISDRLQIGRNKKKNWLGNFALLTLQFIVVKHDAENIYVYKDIQLLQVSECYSNF